MFGQIAIKRAIKRSTGWTATFTHMLSGSISGPSACILYYHRIADVDFIDPQIDDHNVLPAVFERQIAALADWSEIVPLTEVMQRLQQPSATAKPLVSLTFDDGYANFYSNALPILKRYNAPATLSVVTGIIGRPDPAPFDKWGLKNSHRAPSDAWRPLSWNELERCLDSGLVTLGAHSHEHLRANDCTREKIQDEVNRSARILRSRFGESNVPVYAYPYGNSFMGHVPNDYETAVRDAGFELAVTTDFGQVLGDHAPFRLPRVEAHGLDIPATLRAKVQSRISPYYLHDYCRAIAFRSRNGKSKRPEDRNSVSKTATVFPR